MGQARTRVLFALGLAMGLLVLAVGSLCAGGHELAPAQALAEARGILGGEDNGSYASAIVHARLSRTLVGIAVGVGLAVAGVIIQGITHNPLADPGLLGISSGASAAVVSSALVMGSLSGYGTVWAALFGALLATIVVYVVARSVPARSIVTLLLTGTVVSAICTAYINLVIMTKPIVFSQFRFWVVGSLAGRDFEVLRTVAPFIAAGLLVAIVLISGLNNLALGEDVATALGTPVPLVRAAGIAAAALLAAGATAAAGPISFIGLAVPHLIRSVVGENFGWLIPLAGLGGANLVLLADIVARLVVRPEEVLVGVITGIIGAPLLLWAVRKGVASR